MTENVEINLGGDEMVEEIIEFTKNKSNATTLMIINEAIQDAKTTEECLELLVFKCMVLEDCTLGRVLTP